MLEMCPVWHGVPGVSPAEATAVVMGLGHLLQGKTEAAGAVQSQEETTERRPH